MSGITATFGKQDLRGTDCGTHLIWRLAEGLPDAATFQATARQCGVTVYTLGDASVASSDLLPEADRVLLLGFAACREAEIAASLALLGVATGRRKQAARVRPVPSKTS
jgi:GntR family transcriptional regulator/MocR family aminotransferase